MWIDDNYYKELLKIIRRMSRGNFYFEQDKLKEFKGNKYVQLTDGLMGIQSQSRHQIGETVRMIESIIDGDFISIAPSDKRDNEYGILYERYRKLTKHLDRIEKNIQRAQQRIAKNGLIDSRIEGDGLEGKWFDIVSNVNYILESLSTPITEVASVIHHVAKGDLTKKMRLKIDTIEIKGDFLNLAQTINTMVDQLARFASEVTRVAKEVGTDGMLGGQARVEGVSGTWLELTNNVNTMADSLTAQVRNIADITTAVAKGDLSQKITVDAKGEIFELKKTVNTMVDQLARFASEVTRVAKEVGTDGMLGGQARVEGVSGTWLDLTNSVNSMAASLTTQVRNIIEIAVAVANGDLAREIDIDVKGEFLELKDNMNTMIHVLSDSEAKNKNQNWVKDGVSLLNKEVLNKDEFSEQVETAITQLSRYINAGMGVLYIYHTDRKTLKLEASYAYVRKPGRSDEFALGEGIPGQVAHEKKPILLTNVADTRVISTGTTEYKALNTYTSPLIFKDELIGVIELSSHESFTDLHLEYIESALVVLSGSLYASLQSRSTKDLLIQSQAQSKALEEQSIRLKEQNQELETARIEVSRAKELELANKYKSEFLANMSHELRTPLNSMLLLSNSLANAKELDIERVNKQASVIHDAGNGLLSLINDVLDLSKIEANLMSVNIEKVCIRTIFDELELLFAPQAEKKNITLEATISDTALQTFVTDKMKLTQVLKNFLSNAMKFTSEHGTIRLEAKENSEKDKAKRPLAISVIDNGVGIEEEKIDLIFEAFRQADGSTSRKYGGTGLGLSISKELAKLLGGRTGVKSKVGTGSVFTIYLPEKIDITSIDSQLVEEVKQDSLKITQRELPVNTTVPNSMQSGTEERSFPVNPHISQDITPNDTVILVVDDDERFSDIVTEVVHGHDYKVIVVHDGSSAVSVARDCKPMAILLDLVLPGLNGMDVLRVLKADLNTRHIPVKVFSFSDANTDTKKLGALEFIRKPVSADTLDQAVLSLINFVNSEKKHILSIQETTEEIGSLLSDKNVSVSIANDMEDARKEITKNQNFDCIVIDTNLNGIEIVEFLDTLRQQELAAPVILYSENKLSSEEDKKIREYASNMVVKIAIGREKLIEEVSLFLHTSKDSLNREKQQLLIKTMTEDGLLHNKQILIVDDDIRNVFALSAVLEEKNIELVTAQNGQEALDILHQRDRLDLILMDIMMPVMDGYDCMKKIRKMERFKNTPIITLTAKAQKEDRQKCLDAGANDYLTKPIDNEQLLYLLKVWTKNSGL